MDYKETNKQIFKMFSRGAIWIGCFFAARLYYYIVDEKTTAIFAEKIAI